MVLMQRSPKEEADRLQWQLRRLLKLRITNNFTIKGSGLLKLGNYNGCIDTYRIFGY
jgi:hypothetical protein